MPLILCGIDEAGYGPMLGPLCVGMSAFRVTEWNEGDPAPDLWGMLESAVARTLKGAGDRVTIADSKKLKASKDNRRGQLVHLERGVLAFAPACEISSDNDVALLESLGASFESHPWYAGPPAALPECVTAAEQAITGNVLRACMTHAGVEPLALRCATVCESAFNETVRTSGSKAATTLGAVGEHLRLALDRWGSGDDPLRVVCDRLGGRTRYGAALAQLTQSQVTALEESERISRYQLSAQGSHATVSFMPEAENKFLPVALASMTAKFARELAMNRFNRYWGDRVPGLKPTAGYVQDARRWLADTDGVVTASERAAMVRQA